MEYIKIGEIFEYNGEWYQCLKGTSCKECDFSTNNVTCDIHGEITCTRKGRNDDTSVIFKKLEKVGEPYSCNYYGDNRLIMMQEYNLYHLYDVTNKDKIPMSITDYKHKRIAIAVKQNKEDMEEKKQCGDNRFRTIAKAKEHLFQATNIAEDKKELDVLDSFLLRCWQMGWLKEYEDANEKHLKSFNLEAAKSGKPVFTRDGRKARIICFDRKDNTPIVALIECVNGAEILQCYFNNGKCCHDATSDYDLMMLPEKKEGWVNVHKSGYDDFPAVIGAGYIYNTKEEAINNANPDTIIETVKIQWE